MATDWLHFSIGAGQYALPVESVAQVVGLDRLQATNQPGWAGLLPLRDGTLPLADGAILVTEGQVRHAPRRGMVLRSHLPLGFTADDVLGVVRGSPGRLISRIGLPAAAEGVLPTTQGSALVLNPEVVWRTLQSGLEPDSDGRSYRLRPLVAAAAPDADGLAAIGAPSSVQAPPPPQSAQPILPMVEPRPQKLDLAASPAIPPQPAPEPWPGGRVLVFRVGLPADLGVPAEQLIEVGEDREPRPIRGGPKHLAGVLRWRGRLVPLVDLPAMLGTQVGASRSLLYLGLRSRAASVLAIRAAEVAGQAEVPAARPVPRTYGLPTTWVRGAARLGQRPLMILDADALVRA